MRLHHARGVEILAMLWRRPKEGLELMEVYLSVATNFRLMVRVLFTLPPIRLFFTP